MRRKRMNIDIHMLFTRKREYIIDGHSDVTHKQIRKEET